MLFKLVGDIRLTVETGTDTVYAEIDSVWNDGVPYTFCGMGNTLAHSLYDLKVILQEHDVTPETLDGLYVSDEVREVRMRDLFADNIAIPQEEIDYFAPADDDDDTVTFAASGDTVDPDKVVLV